MALINTHGSLNGYPKLAAPAPLGSYRPADVVFLLKDISQDIREKGTREREQAMQSGRHYSEMLPIEYQPTEEYIELFHRSLKETAHRLALAAAIVAETIRNKCGPRLVLVSLARAGTPIGVLIKRYLEQFHALPAPHYSISIIRDKGIDRNALIYILQNHPDCQIQFVDGWTGKGVIARELIQAISEFEREYKLRPGTVNKELAVLADPGYCANIFGTRDDFLIPSACLNATVSGLLSRTVYRPDLMGPGDFHGAKFYRELSGQDLSYYFVDTVAVHFTAARQQAQRLLENNPDYGVDLSPSWLGLQESGKIQLQFGIKNINYVKPGVGETTRVLLRRIPWKVLVRDINHPDVKHVLLLAKDRGVAVEEYPALRYSCYGLVKNLEERL